MKQLTNEALLSATIRVSNAGTEMAGKYTIKAELRTDHGQWASLTAGTVDDAVTGQRIADFNANSGYALRVDILDYNATADTQREAMGAIADFVQGTKEQAESLTNI